MHKKGRVNCLEVLVLLHYIIDYSIKLYRILIRLCQQSEKITDIFGYFSIKEKSCYMISFSLKISFWKVYLKIEQF